MARGAVEIRTAARHGDGTVELWIAFVYDPDGTPIGLSQERVS